MHKKVGQARQGAHECANHKKVGSKGQMRNETTRSIDNHPSCRGCADMTAEELQDPILTSTGVQWWDQDLILLPTGV